MRPARTSHPGVFMYTVFVFLETGYTLLTFPQVSCKYWVFQAKGYPPAWFPTQLREARVESLGLSCTWLRSVAGAMNFHLQHRLTTCVAPRFQGQRCLAPPYCAPNRFLRWRWARGAALTVTHRGAGASPLCGILGPAMQRPMFIANTESDLYKHVTCST